MSKQRPALPPVNVRPTFHRPDTNISDTIEFAVMAEEMGFDGVFVGDRLLAHAQSFGKTVYTAGMIECTTIMAAMAARTKRINIGVLVYIVPYRTPLQAAKTFASLDLISDGRIIMGAGLGWASKEFDSLGIEFATRGARFEESIPLIRRLVSGEKVTFDGRFTKLDEVQIAPASKRPGGPPIWMASFEPSHDLDFSKGYPTRISSALQRVGRLADGWAPMVFSASGKRRITQEHLLEAWNFIAEGAAKVGRNTDDIDFVHSEWIYVLDGPGSEKRAHEAVSNFFPGTYEEAKRTFVIGTPEEVVEKMQEQVRLLPRKADAFLLTPFSAERRQLELVQERVKPLLQEANRKR